MTKARTDRGGVQEILERKEASIERPRGRRFSLRLSCRVCPVSTESPRQGDWAPPAQKPCSITNGNTVNRVLPERVEFAGTVINISRSGILVGLDLAQISSVLRPDGEVRVVIDLPRHPFFSPRCLECTATVVRIVAAEAQTQVAFEIGKLQVKDQNTKAISTRDWLSSPIDGLIQ